MKGPRFCARREIKCAIYFALIVGILAAGIIGCEWGRKTDTSVLRETETFYRIPKGTPFKGVKEDGGPLVDIVVTDSDLVVVYPGYLQKLQEEANRNVLRPE